jgi:uncharacterized protein YbjQ (UPF0145 family)
VEPVLIETALRIGFPLLLLVATYFIGGAIERRHLRDIRRREEQWRGLPAVNFRELPESWEASESALVTGSMVVSVDYFKRFLAGLRSIVGGRVKSYEGILDRARREALLRMKADATDRSFDAVVNVRLETTRVANGRGNGQGIAGLEILAYGTGLKLRRGP